MVTSLKKIFISPRVPGNAAGFVDETFVVVDLRAAGSGVSLQANAFTEIPEGLVMPGFDGQNLRDKEQLASLMRQTAEAAGLGDKKRWSFALPEGSARTLLITLESKPGGKRELDEILAWKLDRAVGMPSSTLRISRQRLTPVRGQERYLVTVSPESVISEYEELFKKIGWHVGLILVKHMGEAEWLLASKSPGDKMLVSVNASGFTSMITRKGEPVLIRAEECEQESIPDELYRITLFYRERLSDPSATRTITQVLVIGRMDRSQVVHSVGEALGTDPELVDSRQLGLDLSREPVSFDQLAAPAGLAALAWQG
jgi:Tfp pilus assembly PilM family ATPase